jgi:flagellar protein FliO/FliZ
MNTDVRSQASPATPAFPVIVGASRKVAKELKTKSRTTAQKQKASVAKRTMPKRKAAPKGTSLARAKTSRKKPDVIKDVGVEQFAAAPVVAVEAIVATESIPDYVPEPIEESLVAEALLEVAEPIATHEVFEPLALAELTLPREPFASIEAVAPVLYPLVAESGLDDRELAADSVTLSSDDSLVLEEPAPLVAKENPLLPVIHFWKSLSSFLTEKWNWAQQKFKSHQVRKRLRVCETVSLGEKRFVAVIQVDGEQFLVGGSSSSVSTLAHLEPARDFAGVFQRHCEQDLSRA